MKKAELKFDYADDKMRRKGMQKAAGLPGVDSVSIDAGAKKLTITGDIDPVDVVITLRKLCSIEILYFGPEKEEKKKEEKKEEKPEVHPWPYSYYCPPYYSPRLLEWCT